jgi:hypothetical protein
MVVLALARSAGEIGPRAGRAMVECCVVIWISYQGQCTKFGA